MKRWAMWPSPLCNVIRLPFLSAISKAGGVESDAGEQGTRVTDVDVLTDKADVGLLCQVLGVFRTEATAEEGD